MHVIVDQAFLNAFRAIIARKWGSKWVRFEDRGRGLPVMVLEELTLNSEEVLPPVDCPLLIQINDVLVKAIRPAFVERKGDELVYELPCKTRITGKFKWTYP